MLTTEKSERLHSRLTEAGVNSRLVIVGGADHGFHGPGNEMSMSRRQIWQTIADFFARNL